MGNKSRSFFLSSSAWPYWILLAFLFKLLFFIIQIHIHPYNKTIEGFYGGLDNDTATYFGPIDNLIKNGSYSPDWRMPGYGAFYLIFILFFNKLLAYKLIIWSQLILSSISVYVLALIALKVFRKDIYFYSTFFLYAISTYTCLFDSLLLTESLSTSLLIFAIYYFVDYHNSFKSKSILLSGFFLMWYIFLRPAFMPLLLILLGYLVIYGFKIKKHLIKNYILFLLPFIVADGAWIMRNYIHHKQIIPLAGTIYGQGTLAYNKEISEFGQSWGGTWYIYTRSDITWFLDDNSKPLPDYIYTSKFNLDSSKMLKNMIKQLKDTTLSYTQRANIAEQVRSKFVTYTQSIKQKKPFLYYIKAPLKELQVFMLSITPFCSFYLNPSSRLFYVILYYIVIALGGFSILWHIKEIGKFGIELVIIAVPAYTIFIHPIMLRFYENRYFVPAYPFMLICAINLVIMVYGKITGTEYQQKNLA